MPKPAKTRTTTRSGLDSAIWSVCDILRRSSCAGALQYVPELTWILFLRILDETEEVEAANAKAVGADFRASLEPPYRWRDWAAPESPERKRMVESTTNAFDLKAVNPNARTDEDLRTPVELIDLIEGKGREVQQLLSQLRGL